MDLSGELKRKLFHNLSLVYMLMYALLPRGLVLGILFFFLLIISAVEFLRLRRPELNAKILAKFGGIHRAAEITGPSGIFWTLLGSWLTMLFFTSKRIVLPALGFMAFGDTLAAIAGKKWGRRPWKMNSAKTLEGSLACMTICALWAMLFVRWPVAILAAFIATWIEARPLPYNDNLWVPFISGITLSLLNLAIGRH